MEPARAYELLARDLLAFSPAEAARALDELNPHDVASLLSEEEAAVSASVLRAMSRTVARETLAAMTTEAACAVIEEVPMAWAASLLRTTDAVQQQRLLAALPEGIARSLQRTLHYASYTVGAFMDPQITALAPDIDAAAAVLVLREQQDSRSDCIYVVGRSGRLQGGISIARILSAAPECSLADLVDSTVPRLRADDKASEVASHAGWTSWRTLPVEDSAGNFVGGLRFETLHELASVAPTHAPGFEPLVMAFAELVWVGLTGMTDGLARVATASTKDHV